MASTLANPPLHQRQSSRSNSASSSSIITVQRAASITSRNHVRPNPSNLRSQSPNEENLVPTHLSARTLSPDARRRSSTIYHRTDSGNGVREGVGNLNRWSQSTASSKSSATHNRKGSFSKRLSGSFGSFGGMTNPQQISPDRKIPRNPRLSPSVNPQDYPARASPTRSIRKLPPIVTLQSLARETDASDSPSTAATITPVTTTMLYTSESTSVEPDYFGERWKGSLAQSDQHPLQQAAALSSFATRPSSPKYSAQSPGSGSSRLPASTDPAISLYSVRGSSRLKHPEKYQISRRRHSRNREGAGKGSAGTEGESSTSSARSVPETQKRKPPSQKAMLSKALQKANHAVVLDNAQNFEGAMDAYGDACALLKQVMSRSSTDDDRRKLEAVRNTYSNRIEELRNTDIMFPGSDGKALPEPPRNRDSQDQDALSPFGDEENEIANMRPGATAPQGWDPPGMPPHSRDPSAPPRLDIPREQKSLVHALNVEDKIPKALQIAQKQQQASYYSNLNSDHLDRITETSRAIEPLISEKSLRLVVSSQTPSSPVHVVDDKGNTNLVMKSTTTSIPSDDQNQAHETQYETAESTSWLDTIDESGGSSSSSVHSRTSSIGLRRKRIRAASGATEAEFDAALDAAVEAAYDDGFEPDDYENDQACQDRKFPWGEQGYVSDARRNVEMAKEMVREAEREAAILLAKDREKRRLQEKLAKRDSVDMDDGDDEEDEERMLEEMTKDYIMDDSEYDLQSKSALPRQSDSSGFSGRTWGSSIGSNPTSAGTSLFTVAEASILPSLSTQLQAKPMPPPAHPPPMGALPPPPGALADAALSQVSNRINSRPPSLVIKTISGVRERRLSGANVKRLKIDANSRSPSTAEPSPVRDQSLPPAPISLSITSINEPPKLIIAFSPPQQTLPNLSFGSPSAAAPKPLHRKELPHRVGSSSTDAAASVVPATPALTKVMSADSETGAPPMPSSPGRFASKAVGLRKNFSSSSLRNRSLTASSSDIFESAQSTSATAPQRRGPLIAVPPPTGAGFIVDRLPADGIYLFENEIHSPITPGLPNPSTANAPLPLEPCPESPLLRPFWFLRCIYQTIAHPRGAYISTKLFVPRDIWRVKSIKLKNLDEKISQCDLLSAALLKLAKVDTLNANSVLEEMQFLETVMDQAQASLSKKLGSEVGVLSASALFKNSSPFDDALSNSEATTSKSTNSSTKSYLSSWRKLRSKNSMGSGAPPSLTTMTSKNGSKEGLTMESLPMTSISDPRFSKRDFSRIQYTGPNSNYMAALAKLCDAVQVLDQIARQVEDPGLKHSSQTHVGLELSMRHAAEFFGFYVCRFVLNDVSTMLEKFIKKGTEWVLC